MYAKSLGITLASVCFLSYFLVKKALQPVEASIHRLRNFIAAASHELKAPMAVIQANAEVIDSNNVESGLGALRPTGQWANSSPQTVCKTDAADKAPDRRQFYRADEEGTLRYYTGDYSGNYQRNSSAGYGGSAGPYVHPIPDIPGEG